MPLYPELPLIVIPYGDRLFRASQQGEVAIDLVLAADLAVAGHDDLDVQLFQAMELSHPLGLLFRPREPGVRRHPLVDRIAGKEHLATRTVDAELRWDVSRGDQQVDLLPVLCWPKMLIRPGYHGIKAPANLEHRYIFEDVPMSLVPIAALGGQYGVQTRGIEAIVRMACIVHHTDYWRTGRTLDKLGLEGLSVSELTAYVTEGVIP